MNKIFPILIALAATFPTPEILAQSQEQRIASAAEKIDKIAFYPSNGWGGVPECWIYQETLDSIASNDDLYRLAKRHRQPAVRAIAFRMLTERQDDRCKEILYESLTDTATFHTISFDEWFSDNVGSFSVASVTDSDFNPQGLHLTGADSLRLDSTLFFTPNMGHISYLYRLIEKLPCDELFYDRLHSLYHEEHLSAVLPALARYRRDRDKQTIIGGLLEYAAGLDKEGARNGEPKGATNNALKAVAEWPCDEFRPALARLCDYEIKRKYFDYYRIRLFYTAVMAYDDQQAFDLIDRTLTRTQGSAARYHKEQFNIAYRDNSRSRFEPLIEKYPSKSVFEIF